MESGRSLETLTAADFRDVKGSRFRLTAAVPAGPGQFLAFDVELAEVTEAAKVTEASGAPADGPRRPFSVLFHGPIEPVLPQRVYRLEHDDLGQLELFIVPVGPTEPSGPGARPTAMRYEAVFG